jgi:uncharacterized protein (DUF1499 family)
MRMAINLGLDAGRLRACPSANNCVCSQDRSDTTHFIEPLRHSGDVARAKQALSEVLRELPRTRLVTKEESYWHVEFRSRLFGFVDDVEFLFEDAAVEPIIHVRSASRVGTYDWGVNRRRIETIRQRLQERVAARRDAPRAAVSSA